MRQLNNPDWGEQVNRATAVPMPLLGAGEQVDYGVQLDDLTAPEYWHLRRGQRFATGASVAALAGNVSGVQLFFPAGSGNALAVVENIVISNENAASQGFRVGFNIPQTPLATVTPNTADTRQVTAVIPGGTSLLTFQTFQAAVSPAPPGALFLRIPTFEAYTVPGPWILGSGSNQALIVQTQNGNVALSVTIFYRERTALSTEL